MAKEEAPTRESATPLPLDLQHQRRIAEKLSEFERTILSGTLHSESGFARKDYIFWALADKSLVTFRAVQRLCEAEFIDDGFALVRILIESVVNGAYISQMNDATADDYADYPDYRDWIEFNQLQAVAPEITNTTSTVDVNEMRRKWELVRVRYENNGNKGQDWCSANLFQRAGAIDVAVGQSYNLMRTLVNLPWRKACTYVHGTAASIKSRVREEDSGVVIHRSYDPKETAGVLYIANMTIFALLALVDIRLGKSNAERWHHLYNEWGASS